MCQYEAIKHERPEGQSWMPSKLLAHIFTDAFCPALPLQVTVSLDSSVNQEDSHWTY